jgi:ParB family chromosome partitioning protein
MLLLAVIFPDPGQPRRKFDEEAEAGLMQTLSEVGMQQPIRVRPAGDRYLIVDGERRYRAALKLGRKEVPCIVEGKDLAEWEVRQRQWIANAQREDLTPAERVRAVAELMKATGWSGTETAKRLGMSEGQVSKYSTIANGPPWVLELLEAGKITFGVAYLIAAEADVAKQAEMRDAALNRVSRNAIAGMKKRELKPSPNGNGKHLGRVTCPLPGGGSFSMSAAQLTTDSFVAYLEDLLAKARKGRAAGWLLQTLIKALKDTTRE